MSNEPKSVARRFREDVASGKDMDLADELLAPDCVAHGPDLMGELQGREAIKQFTMDVRQAFPDLDDTVDEQFSDGDRVYQRFRVRGTHTGELMGIQPNGNTFEVRGIEIVRIADGNVVEVWSMFDTLSVMQQIGAVPAP